MFFRAISRRSRFFRQSWPTPRLQPAEIAYIGDDLTDIVVMHRVGFGVAVANARAEVKGEAHYVTEARGGQGAVREVIELILEARGQWREILDKYEVRG